MHDVAQIAIVRCRRIAHQRIHACCTYHWQPQSRFEPDGRLRPAATLDFEAADDPRRLDVAAERGASNGAGDDHRCKVDGTIRKIIGADRYQELGKCLRDGHGGSQTTALGPGSASGTPGSAEGGRLSIEQRKIDDVAHAH